MNGQAFCAREELTKDSSKLEMKEKHRRTTKKARDIGTNKATADESVCLVSLVDSVLLLFLIHPVR